jgi:hypothetical protein
MSLAPLFGQCGISTPNSALLLLAIIVLTPLLIVGFYEGRKAYWDAQVREMCAKDGGVSIFEEMLISREQAGHLPRVDGAIAITKESLSDPVAPAFSNIAQTVVKNGEPSILRYEQAIVRRSDLATIARAVTYVRTGGDMPSPAIPSSFYCPPFKKINADISAIFRIEESKR